eukprot:GHVR01089385.1.p3 GENE.GHVR01089385.1~~GHVR01089385.1.p3  ORF type:complete len:120 (+),score=5.67 GHVR01089385.1:3025-3384(+)
MNCEKENPTIMDTAMEYPFTIIFRVGMLYSLFIFFLQFLFVKWWLDSSQFAKRTNMMVFFAIVGVSAYGLFVACIDRKRINYNLAANSVFVSVIGSSLAIYIIMGNLLRIKQRARPFIN